MVNMNGHGAYMNRPDTCSWACCDVTGTEYRAAYVHIGQIRGRSETPACAVESMRSMVKSAQWAMVSS